MSLAIVNNSPDVLVFVSGSRFRLKPDQSRSQKESQGGKEEDKKGI